MVIVGSLVALVLAMMGIGEAHRKPIGKAVSVYGGVLGDVRRRQGKAHRSHCRLSVGMWEG